MKQNWQDSELSQVFTLTEDDKSLVKGKSQPYKVLFLILYKFYKDQPKMQSRIPDIPGNVIKFVASQLNIAPPNISDIPERSNRYLLNQLRTSLGCKQLTPQNAIKAKKFLVEHVLKKSHDQVFLQEQLCDYLRQNSFEELNETAAQKLIQSAKRDFDKKLFSSIYQALSERFKTSIDKWLNLHDSSDLEVGLTEIKKSPGAIGVKSAFNEIQKLKAIQEFNLPSSVAKDIPAKILRRYYQRAASQSIWEFKRQSAQARYALLAIFLNTRRKAITDDLVELLIQIIHKIKINAERKVEKSILHELQTVRGKEKILLDMAVSSLENPCGVIQEVLYPVVGGKDRLQNLVNELRSKRHYTQRVYSTIRRSYSSHYRQIIPDILDLLRFKSNNFEFQPLVKALDIITKNIHSKAHYLSELNIPIEEVIPKQLQDVVVEEENGGCRVNRINYEICVFQSLRDRLRCKEVWVEGGGRYCNPDEDLPSDFQLKKEEYYQMLNVPLSADKFIDPLANRLKKALLKFNDNILRNTKVKIHQRKHGWIMLTPPTAQSPPPNLHLIKEQLFKRWSMVTLLDVIKETFLRVPMMQHFKSVASREHLQAIQVQRRVILALYGLGTNTGLKRVAVGNCEENYRNLLHIYQYYITKDGLRNAIAELVNALFEIRDPRIWGTATTACASDPKHFGAWDQNLITEWHNRYHGRGIMIYWHVEEKSVWHSLTAQKMLLF